MSADPIESLVDELDGGTGEDSAGGVLEYLRQLADDIGRDDSPWASKHALALDATVDRLGHAARRAREHLELGDTQVILVSDLDEPA